MNQFSDLGTLLFYLQKERKHAFTLTVAYYLSLDLGAVLIEIPALLFQNRDLNLNRDFTSHIPGKGLNQQIRGMVGDSFFC